MFTTRFGACAAPPDQAGKLTDGSFSDVLAVAISSPLTGSLTLTPLVSSTGSSVPWVIAASTSGVVVPPAGSSFQGAVFYQLSNPADVGKWLAAWSPR